MILNASESVYYFESCTPKDIYTYPMWVRKYAIPNIVIKFTMPFLLIILIAEALLNHEHAGRICLELLVCLLFYIVLYLILPYCRKKRYEKILEEDEDRFACTFDQDSVRIVSPAEDSVLLRSDVESIEESESFFYIRFYNGRLLCIDKEQCITEELHFLRAFTPLNRSGLKQKLQKERDFFLSALLLFIYIFYFFVQICGLGEGLIKFNNRIPDPNRPFSLFGDTEGIPVRFPEKSFQFFEMNLDIGKVKNIEIVGDCYIEYTVQEQSFADSEPVETRYYSVFDYDPSVVQDMVENAFFTPYPEASFSEFEWFAEYGRIKDITVTQDRFVEYTVVEPAEKKRCYCIYEGDSDKLNRLIEKAEYRSSNSYTETYYSSFLELLDLGRLKDIQIIKDRFVEYTFVKPNHEERYYAEIEEPVSDLEQKIADAFYSPYPRVEYRSITENLKFHCFKDVEIIRNRFIEFTFTQKGEETRYCTIAEEDISELTEELDAYGINWSIREEESPDSAA